MKMIFYLIWFHFCIKGLTSIISILIEIRKETKENENIRKFN